MMNKYKNNTEYSKNREIRIRKCTENLPNLAVSESRDAESRGILYIEIDREPNHWLRSCRISRYSESRGAGSRGFYCINLSVVFFIQVEDV